MVRLRNALQAAGRVLRKRGHRQVAVVLPKAVVARASAADLARAATEGIGLSNFDVGSLKTRHDHAVTQIDSLSIIGLNGDKSAVQALKDAVALTDATNRIREWVNAPANAFTPGVFADKVKEAVKGTGLDLKVLDVDDMRRLKMGALLAVARGSDEPAKMIVLRYTGGRKGGPVLALVGKGGDFQFGHSRPSYFSAGEVFWSIALRHVRAGSKRQPGDFLSVHHSQFERQVPRRRRARAS